MYNVATCLVSKQAEAKVVFSTLTHSSCSHLFSVVLKVNPFPALVV